jgi:hypothetical protein
LVGGAEKATPSTVKPYHAATRPANPP